MSARLLWVDDEIDLLRPHCLFLEKRGYDITTASNGNDAVELCRTQRFDLVLLDENMPGLSGLETLAAIKEVQPDVPVVMVTKNEAEDLMDQAIGAQIADYLLKPVNPMQILMALKKNIHRHEIVQEQTESGYRREFAQLALDMDAADDAAAWVELYKRLVHWELQLAAGADGAIGWPMLTPRRAPPSRPMYCAVRCSRAWRPVGAWCCSCSTTFATTSGACSRRNSRPISTRRSRSISPSCPPPRNMRATRSLPA